MALTHGKNGGVYRVGSASPPTKIIATTNWTLNPTAGLAETPKHGDEWMTRIVGQRDWTATVDAFLDTASNQTFFIERLIPSALGAASVPSQSALSTVMLALYLTSATTPRFQGRAIVSAMTFGAAANGVQNASFSFSGTATLQLLGI